MGVRPVANGVAETRSIAGLLEKAAELIDFGEIQPESKPCRD